MHYLLQKYFQKQLNGFHVLTFHMITLDLLLQFGYSINLVSLIWNNCVTYKKEIHQRLNNVTLQIFSLKENNLSISNIYKNDKSAKNTVW